MRDLGRALVVIGLATAAIGIVLWMTPGASWLGRLPGDVRIERHGVRIYVPITTCLFLSAAVSLVLWALGRWR